VALIIDGQILATTEQGFLLNSQDWNENVALSLAERNNLQLSEQHWEIVWFIRTYYQQYRHLPNNRAFVKAVASSLGPDKGNNRYLHRLFPDGPLKFACLLAGLPKPPNCI
jgi:tRNA 2-thiouridine synthesizing protein E